MLNKIGRAFETVLGNYGLNNRCCIIVHKYNIHTYISFFKSPGYGY